MTDSLVKPSLQQEPLWFLHRLDPKDAAYHIGFRVDFDATIAPDRLQDALERVVAGHEALRTSFPAREGRALRRVHEGVELRFEHRSFQAEAQRERAVESFVNRPFDLSRPPLHRFMLARLGEADTLVCAFHHTIFDGSSVRVFLHDLELAFTEGRGPEPKGDFERFVHKQRASREGRDLEALVRGLEGTEPASLLPDLDGASDAEPQGRTLHMDFPAPLWARLRAFASDRGHTPFMVVHAALSVVLADHAGVDDLAVGTVASLRMDAKIRELIGIFVNTLAIPARVDRKQSFEAQVSQAKQACLGAYREHRVPFVDLVEAAAPSRVEGRNPLFSVMLVLHEDDPVKPPELGPRARYREVTPEGAKFDLSVTVTPEAHGVSLGLEYRSDCYSEALVSAFGERFLHFLDRALAAPELPLECLPLAPESHIDEASAFVGTSEPCSAPEVVTEGLRIAAMRTPQRRAYVWEERSFTLSELWEDVKRVAAGLARRVPEGGVVALGLPPSPDGLRAILGCLAAGRTFVPVDPQLPAAWRAELVEGLDVQLWVNASGEEEPGPSASVERLRAEGEGAAPLPPPRPGQLAYVLFTSGSTGRPKGVEVSQGSLGSFLRAFGRGVSVEEGAEWAALSTLGFDIMLLEQLFPLLHGGSVRFCPEAVRQDPQRLGAWLEHARPTVVQLTPTRWRTLLVGGWSGHPELVAMSGGEALTVELARALLQRGSRLVNLYGPTEGTVWWSTHEVVRAELEGRAPEASVSLGAPLPGGEMWLVDGADRPVPLGMPGSLVLSGPRLAEGYHRRPEDGAFSAADRLERARVYRTGDRAVRSPQGDLRYLGRRDDQVKVRGHRVELGAVEAALRSQGGVGEAAVVCRDGELHGFYTTEADLGAVELRRRLEREVPGPMVPSSLNRLELMPRTSSGKIDRGKLEPPRRADAGTSFDPPADPLELQIARLWSEVLKRDGLVARSADFFHLGGQSILAVELAAKLERALGTRISTVDILRSRTVARLAERLRDGGRGDGFYALVGHRVAGAGTPLFTIGASALGHELLPYLDPETPLYSLSPFGLVDKPGMGDRWTRPGSPDDPRDAHELAATFVAEIQRVQPEGPYSILGYCGDVKLAIEIAWQLLDAGQSLGFFGAIDVTDRVGAVDKLRPMPGLLLDFGADYPRWMLRRRKQTFRQDLRRVGARWSARVDRIVGRASSRYTREQMFYARYRRALNASHRPPLPIPVQLFVSTEYFRRTSVRRLEAMAPTPVEVIEVRGLHEGIISPEHVAHLGRALQGALPRGGG